MYNNQGRTHALASQARLSMPGTAFGSFEQLQTLKAVIGSGWQLLTVSSSGSSFRHLLAVDGAACHCGALSASG
eukprot:10271631-Alexandrium_andersonii.AAC.1